MTDELSMKYKELLDAVYKGQFGTKHRSELIMRLMELMELTK